MPDVEPAEAKGVEGEAPVAAAEGEAEAPSVRNAEGVTVQIPSAEDVANERRICLSPKVKRPDLTALMPKSLLDDLNVFFAKCDSQRSGSVTMKQLLRSLRDDAKARAIFGIPEANMGSAASFNKMFSLMDEDHTRRVGFKEFARFVYKRWKVAQDQLLEQTKEVVPLTVSTAASHRVIANNLDATCLIEVSGGRRRGTGVLTFDGYLIAASETLRGVEDARGATVVFLHETDSKGVRVELRPDLLFHRWNAINIMGERLGYSAVAFDVPALVSALEAIPERFENTPPVTEADRQLPHRRVCIMMGAVNAQVNTVQSARRTAIGPRTPLVLIQHDQQSTVKSYHSAMVTKPTRDVLLYDVHRARAEQAHKIGESPGSPVFSYDGRLAALHQRSPIDAGVTKETVEQKGLLGAGQGSSVSAGQRHAMHGVSWGLPFKLVVNDLRETIHQCKIQGMRHAFVGRGLDARRLMRKALALDPSPVRPFVLRALELLYGGAQAQEQRDAKERARGEDPRPWDRLPFTRNIDLLDCNEPKEAEEQVFPEGSLSLEMENEYLLEYEEGRRAASAGEEAKIKGADEKRQENRDRCLALTPKLAFQKVVEVANAATALDEKRPEPALLRAMAWERLGETERALKNYTAAIDLEKASQTEGSDLRLADAYCFRGSCYAARGRLAEANADFDAAIALCDKVPGYFLCRGNVYLRKEETRQRASLDDIPYKNLKDSGDLAQAIQDYASAIALAPKMAQAFYNRARALSAMYRLPPAIKDFNTTIRLVPKHSTAFFNRGMCYQKKVREDWMAAHALAPKNETFGAHVRKANVCLSFPAGMATPRMPE